MGLAPVLPRRRPGHPLARLGLLPPHEPLLRGGAIAPSPHGSPATRGDGAPRRAAVIGGRLLAALAPARGSLAAFAVLAVAVAFGLVRVVDTLVLYLLQTPGYTPIGPALDVVASLVTIAGQGELTAIAALALAAVWARREGARGLVPLLLFAGVLVELALKRVVPQPPPAPDLVRTIHFLPFVEGSAPFSFPSGHILRAFFLAALLGDALPRWRAWLVALAGVVALTRVYLGTHWPSDVVGGLFLGLALAAIADALRRRA